MKVNFELDRAGCLNPPQLDSWMRRGPPPRVLGRSCHELLAVNCPTMVSLQSIHRGLFIFMWPSFVGIQQVAGTCVVFMKLLSLLLWLLISPLKEIKHWMTSTFAAIIRFFWILSTAAVVQVSIHFPLFLNVYFSICLPLEQQRQSHKQEQ